MQLAFAVIQALHDDFIILRCQHTSQLTSAPIGLFGEIALGDPFPLSPGRHPGHVDIQDLPGLLIIMPITATMLSQDHGKRTAHLHDILWRTGIQGVTHRRLFGTRGPTKGALQGPVGPHTGIDLDDADTARQDIDETIQEFVGRRMLADLLLDLDLGLDDRPDAQLLKMDTECYQTRPCGEFD